MSKLIQLKDGQEDVYTSSILKQVSGLNVKAGESHTDTLIKKAKQIVIYYSIHPARYKKNFIVAHNDTEWFWDINHLEWVIFIKVDWNEGTIIVSQNSTADGNVCVMGYDLIL